MNNTINNKNIKENSQNETNVEKITPKFIKKYQEILQIFSNKGRNVRYESVYDEIILQRENNYQDEDDKGIWQEKGRTQDWTKIIDICTEVLINSSKDLQILAWLIEATLHKYGINALLECISIFAEFLIEIPEMYPESPDAQDNIVEWIDKTANKIILKNEVENEFDSRILLEQIIGKAKNPKNQEKELIQKTALIQSHLNEIENIESSMTKIERNFRDNAKPFASYFFKNTIETLKIYKNYVNDNICSKQKVNESNTTEQISENKLSDIHNMIKKILEEKPHEISTYILNQFLIWENKTFVDFVNKYGKDKNEFFTILKFLGIDKNE
ncbi:type VI secretion system ImpA family N-terminal domain-containing protein [Candidatus Gromoviella agglomerans]|uniref:type VI secretion system ImpA family N-terminal domain-containing protein n=1 Tax=Candidatus Gromoviella agglomerans TaxID=2806609 RepID=UPI001E592C25|nr:type VI secretion system ImpA family N-terminal domain-containing protein [Candidatus Gromoviella agglomerans]UFX98625.1 TssA-like protein Type VI secretion system [Candidatus Gromoviella agglomerans]